MASTVRIGRPTFLRDTGLSLVFGAIGALPAVAVVALTGYPEWGQTLLSFMVVLACFYVVGLAVRLLLHAGEAWISNRVGHPDPDLPRSAVIAYTDPVLRVAAGSAGAASALALAYLAGTGQTSLGG